MTLNKQALRQKAEKAGVEEWQSRKMPGSGGECTVIVKGSLKKHPGWTTCRPVADDIVDKKTMDFIAASNPATVLALLDELDSAEKQTSALFKENARLKSGIAGLVHLGIRHGDIEVMSIAGDAQLSTPCTDSIIEKIAAGIGVKGE
ncbi:ead/Ea22-like family protein [Salmonella enterica]|nr:ead/Ea22-like family protein [Salmonella enterica]